MIGKSVSRIKGLQEVQNALKEYREGGALELKQYREIDTIEECRKAIEKQIPMEPKIGNDNGRKRKCCASCGCFYSPASRYCSKCGQAIDWSEK